ncbi:glycosyl transferase [Pseudomonas turukhanskensis]|uniref:Glycosyl transferase n=1 Tax=Pseudomonas turukhanskensis TaxID=1806536 RepID=A0A9W6K8E1_9PSED|nr:glycosyl transferase [Pseudomonas turukhanskensis]
MIVTDAWSPQVNGVVTSLQALIAELRGLGHLVKLLSPADFRHVPCPTYPEIPLVWDVWNVGAAIRNFRPDCVHLATEGPLGWTARRWLKKRGLAFSSAIHTRFPEYVHTRWPRIPLAWGYAYLRRFHQPSQAVLVTTARLRAEFQGWGLQRLQLWRKGVDLGRFQATVEVPRRLVFLYVGRVAPEKNLEAFLRLDLPGEKQVIGDGPQRAELQTRYPQVSFLGYQHGSALAKAYSEASVLVFPSRTDTYGLVMLEALASGTPVAAFPVPGPLDVLEQGVSGVMDEDLRSACLAALSLDRQRCEQAAQKLSWRASALEFLVQQPLLDGELVEVGAEKVVEATA